MPSVYVHIPFCQSRCIYCDFYSTTNLAHQQAYVEALISEMKARQTEWPLHARTLSIYLGGGTPSTLPLPLLQQLLEEITCLYPPVEDAEITIEANPDDVTDEWVKALKHTLVNRISMGVQTFNDELLKTLHRRHSSNQAHEAVRRLQEAGYTNLSIDLIYGLPGQDMPMWESDVETALELKVPHLSAYSLMYEEGTPIMRMLERGVVNEMDDETFWKCYELLCKRLEDAGYEHYEISNFALPNMHSRHNSGYWTGEMYMGFGAGAHSYDGSKRRRCNKPSLGNYITCLTPGKGNLVLGNSSDSSSSPNGYYEIEELSPADLYNEFVMTRLRTSKGFSLNELEERFGTELRNYCQRLMWPHLKNENLQQEGQRVFLSRKGIFVSNDVISDLFLSAEDETEE